MVRSNCLRGCILSAGLFIVLCTPFAWGLDWPQWRGPNRDGISAETGWLASWPPALVWTQSVGMGYSSVAVSEGRVYTHGWYDRSTDEDEVRCLDADTGAELWSYSYAHAYGNSYRGPRATPTVDGNEVYTFSNLGQLKCFNKVTGALLWSKTVNVGSPGYKLSGSPLIEGNLVILNAGGRGVAVDKNAPHDIVWTTSGTAGYSSPFAFTYNSQRTVVLFSGAGLYGVNPANGSTRFSYAWTSTANAADPVIYGDKVFISTGYGQGCAMLQLGSGALSEVWSNRDMENHFSTCVLRGDYLYGFDGKQGDTGAPLRCVDAREGTVKWSKTGFRTGSLLSADGKLIILGERGDLAVARVSSSSYDTEGRAQVTVIPNASAQHWWTSPALSDGRIYCRSYQGTLACLSVGGSTPVPQIAVSRTSMSVSGEVGQNAASETFQVWNSGDGTLAYNVTDDTSKLSVAPASGTSTGSGDKKTHTVTFTTSDLAAGVYDRTITVADNGSGAANSPVTIDVHITVTEPAPEPAIAVSTTSMSVSCEVGQNAASETFQVWNGGDGTLAYNVTDDTSKLSVAPASGTSTGSGDKTTHTVTFTTSDLAAGVYDRTITVEDNGSGAVNGPITIDVHITVTAPAPEPAIAVSTTSISVSCEVGQNAGSETFQVWNGGDGTLAYNVVETTSKLSVAPASGTSTGTGAKTTHTIMFTTSDLAEGVYDRTITVEDNGSGAVNGPITIDVHITVEASSHTRVVEVRVGAETDDAEEDAASGTMYLKSSDLELVRDGTADQVVGIRFASVAVPFGATIEKAYVQFQVDETSSESTSLTIRGEKSVAAQPFGETAGDISGRPATGGSVAWSPPAWSTVGEAGAAQRTPDLAVVIKEIVDQPGWMSGNPLVLIVTGSGKRVAESYIGDAAGAPLLHVEFSPGIPVDDDDRDAMADNWEAEHFGDTNAVGCGPLEDFDGDGYCNLDEFIAGTDPSGSASSFFGVNVTLSSGSIVVSFQTIEASGTGYAGVARYYSLESSANAGEQAVWTGVANRTNILGTGQTVTYTAPSGSALFYRGKVWLVEE
ncbi:MAG: PQQ-like beta-propeller repeat protein [Kiritimatiellae bacterium]|nr:PQQ-like beta-propeller repeat protein [Kiritimatiellia bacterium]